MPLPMSASPHEASVYDRVKTFLSQHDIVFREVHHQPTRTSEESARARGEDIAVGGKAILFKIDDDFKLFVLSAAKKISSSKLKQRFRAARLRFATQEELLAQTGLVPGAVPPFGKPVMPFDLYVDTSITRNSIIAFNAGSLTTSIIMDCRDYLRVAGAEVFEFGE